MYLVKGPSPKQVAGYAFSRTQAQEIARELNRMIDSWEEKWGIINGDHYSIQKVKSARRHLGDCKQMGFPF